MACPVVPSRQSLPDAIRNHDTERDAELAVQPRLEFRRAGIRIERQQQHGLAVRALLDVRAIDPRIRHHEPQAVRDDIIFLRPQHLFRFFQHKRHLTRIFAGDLVQLLGVIGVWPSPAAECDPRPWTRSFAPTRRCRVP